MGTFSACSVSSLPSSYNEEIRPRAEDLGEIDGELAGDANFSCFALFPSMGKIIKPEEA